MYCEISDITSQIFWSGYFKALFEKIFIKRLLSDVFCLFS